ncbi:CAP domain-containing protein [Alkaliphilus transvaalensis]|uniref:CAP domain-containing protein n=1 Tax=Alkaliphilus transvaalensis TaxID=114628 RepID=UPI00047B9D49|nr:CAP domain-containing protein [Alkaliphilus transvaalensis]
MKKKYLILLVLSIFLVSCRAPQERPVEDNNLETNESSIFKTGDVEHCRITSDSADVKSGIGFDFDTIATLKRDDVVRVLEQVGDWYVIQLDNNQVGSIDATSAEPIVRDVEVDEEEVSPPHEPEANEEQPGITQQDPARAPQDETTPLAEEQQQPITTRNQEQAQGQGGNLRSQEERMVQLINQERERNGLPTLQIDAEVAQVAGVKSQDMVDNDYFSHYSPTYGSPFEMLDSFGVNYLHAGENLAGNNNVDNAHVALMGSSGHRQNILNPNFTHVGIGVRTSPRYGFVYTQMFISKPR